MFCTRPARRHRKDLETATLAGRQCAQVPIDDALKQWRVVTERRSANSRPLGLFVPQPDPHGFLVEPIPAEGCDLLRIHRSALQRKSVNRGARQLAEIGWIGRTEI